MYSFLSICTYISYMYIVTYSYISICMIANSYADTQTCAYRQTQT